MRIQVHKVRDGVHEVLLVPGRRAKLAPVLVRGTDRGLVQAGVLESIKAIRGEPEPETPSP